MTGAAPSAGDGIDCCEACVRRAWLVARLAGRLELARHERRPLRDVLALDDHDLVRAIGGRDRAVVGQELRAVRPDRLRARIADAGLGAVCRHADGYPDRLRDDRAAPAVLHVLAAGSPLARLAALVGAADRPPSVAVVGTRRASPDGVEIAHALGRGLAAAGVTVVSGMALGVDSAAHAGAIAGGGRTVAVLAGSAESPYPVRKRALHAAIREHGAVVSELPPAFRAYRWSFPARNRIIAALADVTVVVEAAERSGSLITAELATELGREVGAVPGAPLSWRSAGTNSLLRDGAHVIRHARDALDLVLGVAGPAAPPRAPALPADLPAALRDLLAAVEDGRDTLATLAPVQARVPPVLAGLSELELRGLLRRVPGGRWARRAG